MELNNLGLTFPPRMNSLHGKHHGDFNISGIPDIPKCPAFGPQSSLGLAVSIVFASRTLRLGCRLIQSRSWNVSDDIYPETYPTIFPICLHPPFRKSSPVMQIRRHQFCFPRALNSSEIVLTECIAIST